MSDYNSPLRVNKRSTRAQLSTRRERGRRSERDLEKYDYTDSSDYSSSYDSEDSSALSSRETSGSYSSNQPMLRKKPSKCLNKPRSSTVYRLPQRVVRYLCLALISTVVIVILGLVRMSFVSSKRVEDGKVGERPPPPPAPWESFNFLTRYYGGIRTLVSFDDNKPEYPLPEDELPLANSTSNSNTPVRDMPSSQAFLAYTSHNSSVSVEGFAPVEECFLDLARTISVPKLQYYAGRPSGFPDNVMGSYELLGLPEDICFERYGRLGPYGLGYSTKFGGTGAGQHGDIEGSENVWAETEHVDYRKVKWGDAQQRCKLANAARFNITQSSSSGMTASATKHHNTTDAPSIHPSKFLPRTAVVVRSYDDFKYREEDILQLRAMISELSLGSGGEYDVHLLVQVKDEGKHPIWADEETYNAHLAASVPEEFHDITTLWSETQMLMLYQGIFDVYARGPDLPIHGSYRGLQMAMQHFAQKHQEYEFFWHWEIDIRYTGHYYNLFEKIGSWSKKQPRKGLWERSSRFYVPSVHGAWEDFKQMVRVQTEMGTESPDKMWMGLRKHKANEKPKVDKPIWGPERPKDPQDWFETENDPKAPGRYDTDKYVWGVGEEADLISFNPLFDPEGTSWYLKDDITGYNTTEGLPPRRAAIVTSSRMSRRLLNTMHRETVFKKHHAFSEMWAPTAALHHGYKAVYVPHPMFVDREWPTAYLASVMNAGRNGATGAARTSVFGEREHNLLGMTWYYNAGFAPNLWKRWLGLKVNNEGGEEFETVVDEGRDGNGVNGMRGGEGRMCLPPMLLHPVKSVELPVESVPDETLVTESDPTL